MNPAVKFELWDLLRGGAAHDVLCPIRQPVLSSKSAQLKEQVAALQRVSPVVRMVLALESSVCWKVRGRPATVSWRPLADGCS